MRVWRTGTLYVTAKYTAVKTKITPTSIIQTELGTKWTENFAYFCPIKFTVLHLCPIYLIPSLGVKSHNTDALKTTVHSEWTKLLYIQRITYYNKRKTRWSMITSQISYDTLFSYPMKRSLNENSSFSYNKMINK